MKLAKFLLFLIVTIFIFACAQAPKVDPGGLQVTPADSEQVVIPKVCEPQYEAKKFKVAVVDFANNTGFGEMTATNTQVQGKSETTKRSAAVAGVVVGPGAAGFAGASASHTKQQFSTDINTFYRQIAPNIGEYAQSAVESALMEIGGVQVFTRQQMMKVLTEQNFQMNVADPNAVVRFGKISGVDYIVTGSVDNIKANYVSKSDTNSGNVWVNLLTSTVNTATAGWNVNTEMTVQLIDASTGQLIFSKKVSGRELAGEQPAFNPELVVNAAKKAFGESIDDIKPDLSDLFGSKAYINQLRGNKQVAQISLGKSDGIKPGDKIIAYDFMEIQDFKTKKTKCNKNKIDVEMVVTNQVDDETAWVKITGDPEQVKRIKIGTLVKRAPLEGQGFMKKLF